MPEITFEGETFTVVETVNDFALMEFAASAADGTDGDDMAGLVAIYRLLKAWVAPTDWARFSKHARVTGDTDKLIVLIGKLMAGTADRPTQRSSDSSDGPSTTPPSSGSSSAEPALTLLAGRPDLQLAVVRAQEQQAS